MPDAIQTYSDDELSAAISAAMERHVEANRARDATLAALTILQEEQAARKAVRKAEAYEEVRRIAVSRGLQPPPPPKGCEEPSARAAALRLAALPTIRTRRGDDVPIGEARPAVDPETRTVEPVICGVSDHAVVRYLERVVGMDMAAMRARILTPFVEGAIRSGVVRIRTSEGVVVVREGVVTSFLPSGTGPSRGKKRHVDRGRGNRRRPDPFASSIDDAWSASVD
jgi:hypothetical protein